MEETGKIFRNILSVRSILKLLLSSPEFLSVEASAVETAMLFANIW